MAIADIRRYLAEADGDARRERLRRDLTVVFVPMLNPDGAELFQRVNAAGIDVNRDARRFATPEARSLKALRDQLRPRFGFNLHDQNARTRVGPAGLPAAIALLAPARDSGGGYDDVRSRARLVAATIAEALRPEIPGRVAKYDDEFNPRAFGDLMQQWGTSTVLIESGVLPNDPEKQRLRALNVAAILAALDAIAAGSYAAVNPAAYEALPYNTGGAADLLVLGGRLVLPGAPPIRADVAVNYDDPVARTGGHVRDVGDLEDATAIDTVNAAGLFVHPAAEALTIAPGGSLLRIGAPAVMDVRRGAGAASAVVRRVGKERPASAPGRTALPDSSRSTAAPTYEVYAIRYGVLRSFPVAALVAGADTARRMDVALTVWLLKGSDGRAVLVDAGFYRDKFLRRWKPADFVKPSDAVRRAGVRPEDVTDVIVSHVHWDHVDGADLFPRARVWIQRDEYAHHVDEGGRPRNPTIDSVDAAMLARLRRAGRVRLVEGDAQEVLPGVTVYTGGKHTFASQYAGVRTAAGVVVIASDNAYLYENLTTRTPIAQTLDSAANRRAQERMARLAASERLIVPGHDPAVFVRHPTPGGGVARIR